MGRFSLDGSIDAAVRKLKRMVDPKYVTPDKAIPLTLLKHCEGIAFITIVKAGLFFIGGNLGGGCVIAKVKDESNPRGWRWSAPSSVGCGGLGGGFIFGGEKIDSIIILNTKSAVRAFMGSTQVNFGGNVSLAVGPVGKDIEAHVGVSNTKEIVAAYSYSQAQGAYIGGTLEGSVLLSRNDDNKKFYGDKNANAQNILSGNIQVPLKAKHLADELDMLLYNPKVSKTPSLQQNPSSSYIPVATPAPKNSNESSYHLPTSYQLPEGWEIFYDNDGKPYYYNKNTRKTQWEKPTGQSYNANLQVNQYENANTVKNLSSIPQSGPAYSKQSSHSSASFSGPSTAPSIPARAPAIPNTSPTDAQKLATTNRVQGISYYGSNRVAGSQGQTSASTKGRAPPPIPSRPQIPTRPTGY